ETPVAPRSMAISDEEVERVMTMTYGPVRTRLSHENDQPKEYVAANSVEIKPECLLVDGYNVIFSWDELAELAKVNLGSARDRLIDILANYQGYRQCELIVVFDAYKVAQGRESIEHQGPLSIVYTREAQTADMYIEAASKKLASEYRVVVATSDALEQRIVIGHGATRISSNELRIDIEHVTKTQKEAFDTSNKKMHVYAFEDLKHLESEE
ncbi:MAG: NYN domain-containing protein, partial [Erysipelotrichaceae bacterium]|nr:NYN domain-containing protein [Erysipelotrichaceae bacterium]